MRPIRFTHTGAATQSAWIPLDKLRNPFNVGFGVTVTGTVNYTIQHTFSNLQDGSSVNVFNHPDVASETTSQDGTYAFPVNAIRVSLAGGSTGSVEVEIIQAGHVGA